MREQIQHLKSQLTDKEIPKIHRVTEPVPQIIYQENPYIQEKLNQVYEELEKSLKIEQKIKNELIEKE